MPTRTPARPLAALRAEWDAPFLADPADHAANDERGQLTRELAASILAADLMTTVGDLFITTAGWSRERGDQANSAGKPGSEQWLAALGTPEHATLTADGRHVNRAAWCKCPQNAAWVRYEYWTAEGCQRHGFVCAGCRRLIQVG